MSFSSEEGRRLLQEALADGHGEAFFPLVSQLHTQAEVTGCGLGSLVTVLNALELDPGRTWKGPWRFWGEEVLVCCQQVEALTAQGSTLDQLAVVAGCHGAAITVHHATDPQAFADALAASVTAPSGPFLVANYDRGLLGQTGTGHFSPLAAWHRGSDRVLVLDVARFKYPPHWVSRAELFTAMAGIDPDSGAPRGWLSLARPGER
ncbi:MAG: phytochelatin synthase family protein [Alphaproteobacteria bacterium]|nr:phytochelatin synthase family protein [Alphaproteobacteria bacterium]